jgi:hypothetical protein
MLQVERRESDGKVASGGLTPNVASGDLTPLSGTSAARDLSPDNEGFLVASLLGMTNPCVISITRVTSILSVSYTLAHPLRLQSVGCARNRSEETEGGSR